MLQSEIIRPITERLLTHAGVGQGARVLDLGCGAGDVSLLAAKMVGASGSVVGIDRSAEAIVYARNRACDGDLGNVDFHVSSVKDFSSAEPFDLVIGRYVLLHQPVPAAFIRTSGRHVKAGGVIAFHELGLHRGIHSLPATTTWIKIAEWFDSNFRLRGPGGDAAGRLVEHFLDAGLPYPELFAELPIAGGENSPFYGWMAETIRSLMPRLLEHGVVTKEEVSIATLEQRLRSEAIEAKSQVEAWPQICAWVKL
jgi:SAM-dependent methyltransferase